LKTGTTLSPFLLPPFFQLFGLPQQCEADFPPYYPIPYDGAPPSLARRLVFFVFSSFLYAGLFFSMDIPFSVLKLLFFFLNGKLFLFFPRSPNIVHPLESVDEAFFFPPRDRFRSPPLPCRGSSLGPPLFFDDSPPLTSFLVSPPI